MFTLETDTRCNNLCYNDTFAYYPLWLALSASVAEKVIEKYQRMVKKEGSLPGIGCKTLSVDQPAEANRRGQTQQSANEKQRATRLKGQGKDRRFQPFTTHRGKGQHPKGQS